MTKGYVYIFDVVADLIREAAFAAQPAAIFCQDYFWNGACFEAGDAWLDQENGDHQRPLKDVLEEWLSAVDDGGYDGNIDTSTEEGKERDEKVALRVILTIADHRHEHTLARIDTLMTAATVRRLLTEHS